MDISKLLDQIALDNKANVLNGNKGTTGTNRTYDQAQGNRGKQLNPNQTANSLDPAEALDEGDIYGGSETSD